MGTASPARSELFSTKVEREDIRTVDYKDNARAAQDSEDVRQLAIAIPIETCTWSAIATFYDK